MKLEEAGTASDFIYEFLNDTKKGYSVHFASAAAMMFRYYGIPCPLCGRIFDHAGGRGVHDGGRALCAG